MAIDPDNSTFQQTNPRRPGLYSDILNGEKTNAPPGRPVPPNIPAAEEYMQIGRLLEAYGFIVPVARISVTGGATPAIAALMVIRSDIDMGDVTVDRDSAGVVSLTFPEGSFPGGGCRPTGSLNSTDGAVIVAERIANGVKVTTLDDAGVGIDADFTVELFGQ